MRQLLLWPAFISLALQSARGQDAPPVKLSVEPAGRIKLVCGQDEYLITSRFSHPAGKFNGLPPGFHFNTLGDPKDRHPFEEGEWKVEVKEAGGGQFVVVGQGGFYRVERRVIHEAETGFVRIHDTVVNTGGADLGLAIEHTVSLGQPIKTWWIAGLEQGQSQHRCEENPTAFVVHGSTGLGTVYVDDVMRNQLHQEIDPLRGTITGSTRNFGLAKGASYTIEWAVYPAGTDYFDFINAVRRDWNVNYTLAGLPGFFNLGAEPWTTLDGKPDAIRHFFDRKRLEILIITPHFLYDYGYLMTREQYKDLVGKAMRQIRAVAPNVKFAAFLEPSIQWVPRSVFEGRLPDDFGFGPKGHRTKGVPAEASAVLDKTVWADSLWRDELGHAVINTRDYYRNEPGWPAIDQVVGLQLFPLVGNYRFKQFNEQIDFLLDDVGMDGVFFDLWNYAGDMTYDRWDGHTVMLDQEGHIARKYAMISLLSDEARRSWVDRIHAKGKLILTNGMPITRRLQTPPIYNFFEAPNTLADSGPAPDNWLAARCQLSSPLALGPNDHVFRNQFPPDQYARTFMRAIMAFLRYGVLYVEYNTQIPEQGPGAGEFGVLNHMYPITPVELHSGWIKGRERIVGCVSFETMWQTAAAPAVLAFDVTGRKIDPGQRATLTRAGDGLWNVKVKLADWQEFVVIVGETD